MITVATRPCGHDHHVGTCPACQRALTAMHQEQLDAATAALIAWRAAHLS